MNHFLLNAVAARLTNSKEGGSHIDRKSGRPFVCAYARIDLRPQGIDLFLTLVAGSASKTDATTGRSPVVENLANDIRTAQPGLLFAKRQDRFFRQAWNQAPFWNEIDALKDQGRTVFIADGKDGLWGAGKFSQAERLLSGSEDQAHANTIYTSTRASMVTYTGTDARMVNGSVAYHLPSIPPPGLTRIRLVGRHPAGAVKYLFIDTPSNFPAPELALSTLPIVRDANGMVADQVATLRWYFSVAGPQWSVKGLGSELIRRGMSSDGPRSRRGPAATYTLDDIYSVQETIWENLELYATGIMRRTIGGENITISGLFPPDGEPWGREEDFARMRVWLRGNKARVARQVGATFTGVKCTRNGVPFTLISQLDPDSETPGQPTVRYLLRRANTSVSGVELEASAGSAMDTSPAGATVPAWVRHEWLAQMVLDGLRHAQRVPVPLYIGDDTDIELAELRGATALAETKRTNLEINIEVLEHDIDEVVPGTKRHVMPESVRERKWKAVEKLEKELQTAEAELATAQAALDDYLARVTDIRRGLEANQVADVLVSLLNPQDTTHQRLWKSAIHNMTIQASKVKRCGIDGTRVDVTFHLHVSDGTTTVAIPTSSSHEYGPITHLPERARLLMNGLRDGIPMDRENSLSDQRAAFRYLRDHVLEQSDGRVAFLHCREPELLRLGTRVLFPTPDIDTAMREVSTDIDLLNVFSKPAVLAHRLLEIHPPLPSLRGTWLQLRVSQLEAQALIRAAAQQGRVTVDSFPPVQFHALRELLRKTRPGLWEQVSWKKLQLIPCPNCGSTAQLAMTFREVSGYVCLSCRHDRLGITWPADRFDGFVALPERWTAAGHVLLPARPLPAESETLARLRPRRYRKVTELSREQIAALLHDAGKGDSLRALSARYGVSAPDIRRLMRTSQVSPSPQSEEPSNLPSD